MRRPLRRLAILLALLALTGAGWVTIGEAAARRAAGAAVEATRERRRQAELLPVGATLWAYQRSYAPLRALPGAGPGVAPGPGDPAGVGTPAAVGVKPVGGAPALPPVEPALVGVDIRRWYARPLAERWGDYQSAAWRPIRLATRGLWFMLGVAVAGSAVRAAGVGLLALPRALVAPLRFVVLLVFRPQLTAGSSHGSARWAPPWTRLGLRLRRRRAQLVLGRTWVGPLPVTVGVPEEEQYYGVALVAPPGAGKTSRVLIPAILRECLGCRREPGGGWVARLGHLWHERWRNLGRRPPPPRSFIASDPKGELIRATSRAARRGHAVLLLDFLHPGRGQRYNPLAHVRSALDAELVAEAIVANTGKGKESFWEQLSQGMIANGALYLVRTKGKRRPPTLADLRAFLAKGTPEEVLTELADSRIPEIVAGAAMLARSMHDNEKMKGAAFADLQNRLRWVDLPEIAAVTAKDEIDLAAFGRRPLALYIRFDQHRTQTLAPLTAVFYAQLFDTLMAQAAANRSGRLAVPVLFYLEEFGNIGVLPGIEKKMAQLRSYGVGFFLVLQNLAQLENNYGEAAAEAIFESCWTRLCLAGVGTATGEAFSKLAGERTVLAASQGEGRALTRVPWADSGQRGALEAGRPLVTADELRTMGDRLFVVMGKRRPLLVRPRPYYRDPLLRGLVPDPGEGDPLAEDFQRADRGAVARPKRPRQAQAAGRQASATGARPVAGEGAGDPPADGAPALAVAAGALPPVADAPSTVSHQGIPEQAGAPPPDETLAAPAGTPDQAGVASPADALADGADAAGSVRLSDAQRLVLEALAATGRPGSAVSSTELAKRTGLNRNSVRVYLMELRDQLGIDQAADIVQAARERGLLGDEPRAAD